MEKVDYHCRLHLSSETYCISLTPIARSSFDRRRLDLEIGLAKDIVGIIHLLELQQALVIRAEDDPSFFLQVWARASVRYSSEIRTFLTDKDQAHRRNSHTAPRLQLPT